MDCFGCVPLSFVETQGVSSSARQQIQQQQTPDERAGKKTKVEPGISNESTLSNTAAASGRETNTRREPKEPRASAPLTAAKRSRSARALLSLIPEHAQQDLSQHSPPGPPPPIVKQLRTRVPTKPIMQRISAEHFPAKVSA